MEPTKQEEYDASKEPLDLKRVYTTITEMTRHQQEFAERVGDLQKLTYMVARTLEEERMKTMQLRLRVRHLEEKLDDKGLIVR